MTVTAKFTSGTNIDVSWNAVAGATSYNIEVTNSNQAVVATRTITSGTSTSITLNAYGTFNVNLIAKNGAANVGGGNASVTVPQSYTVGGITVSSVDSSNVNVTWSASAGVSIYYYSYTVSGSNTASNGTTSATSVSLPVAYSSLTSFSLRVGNKDGALLGTWTPGSTLPGVTTPGVQTTGSVSYSAGYLTWSYAQAYVAVYRNSQLYGYLSANGSVVTNAYQRGTFTNSAYIGNLLSTNYSGYSLTFVVYSATTNGQIGSATYYGGTSTTPYGSTINVVANPTTNQITVSWTPYTGADSYYVEYKMTQNSAFNGGQTVTGNTCTLSWTPGYNYTVTVYAARGGMLLGAIGSASITGQGYVTYTGNSWSGGWGGNITGNSNYVYGMNCQLYITGVNSSTLTWTTTVSGPYMVLVVPTGGNPQSVPAYSTTCTLPVGSGTSFYVVVYTMANNTQVAAASYTATTSSTGSDTSNVKSKCTNLTVTQKSSSVTTISWEPLAGATSYEVEYGRLGAAEGTTSPTQKGTSFDLPYGKATGFEAYVYAWVSGIRKSVGTIIHVANDDFPKAESSSTTTPSTPQEKPLSAYVTGFKGTVGTSGTIILSWNEASGNPSYEIYYKKSTASSWKKLYTTTARSLKVNKLTNGTSYDFKVVANGRDSGILTMTIGTTSQTLSAADPAGAGTSTSAVPVITSISGGSGTITLSWNGATGAVKYQVWTAPANSTKYTKRVETASTAATISNLPAGEYKVMIKASMDGKTWPKFNDSDCVKSASRSVTVR